MRANDKAKKPKSKEVEIPPNRKKRSSFIKRSMWLCVFLALTLIIAAICTGALIYASQTLNHDKLEIRSQSSILVDRNGAIVATDNDYIHTTIEDIAPHTKNAFIAVEDKSFYSHNGFSYRRIAKALYENLRSGQIKQGASTITQQLIKNTHLTHERSLKRKVREAALAIKLERAYSKNEILEMYLNVIYFGNGCYGIGSAANFYFKKPASDLSILESAALAGMIRNPSSYCPIRNPQNFDSRARLVLSLMKKQNLITDSELDDAESQNLTIARKNVIQAEVSYYKQYALSEAARLLNMDTADFATSNYKVYSYLDPDIQMSLTKTITASEYGIKALDGAQADKCAIIATPNGEVLGYYANTPTLRAAKRNFASALKPITVYAPAFELGIVAPSTKILDEDFVSGDFHPKNHDGKFHGEITVREALEQSYNVPAVKILDYSRISRSTAISRNLGLQLGEDEKMGIALGATQNGTTFNELLSSYCALSTGKNIQATPIRKIVDKDGRIVFENMPRNIEVLHDDTCFLVKDILKSGTKTGIAKRLGSLPFDVAAKTGTCERENASTNTDAVICALTNDHVMVVWAGNAKMTTNRDLPKGMTGGGIVSYIARDVLADISKSPAPFSPPKSVIREKTADGKEDWFSLRHPKTLKLGNSDSTEHLHPLKIESGTDDDLIPYISFECNPRFIYEIYKVVNGNEVLQEVVKHKSIPHTFIDKNIKKGKTERYIVKYFEKNNPDKLGASNEVSLFAPSKIKKNSQKNNSKNIKKWFF